MVGIINEITISEPEKCVVRKQVTLAGEQIERSTQMLLKSITGPDIATPRKE